MGLLLPLYYHKGMITVVFVSHIDVQNLKNEDTASVQDDLVSLIYHYSHITFIEQPC